ncbi:hypothetical protein AVEN_91523-1 [Araneus ventricosus]|uniref:Uncharacterized protein n=1 Tax=Araneus ventricosus TaxID=182803 RepID=A0A4Y2BLS6_ARAVE|nr:hypothetical protein AVEN_91523-1 [Araneus ventricosus]
MAQLLPKEAHTITRWSSLDSHQGRETPLTYPAASRPRTLGAPQWETAIEYEILEKEHQISYGTFYNFEMRVDKRSLVLHFEWTCKVYGKSGWKSQEFYFGKV